MYWIYLAIFILIILTPKIIQDGILFLREEDVESLIIFGFGILAFILYLAKEKALLRVFKEKLRLQKRTNIITRDLSDSYSYIGEMNRKFDIVKDLVFHLPQGTADMLAKKEPETYQLIIEAAKLLAKTDSVSLRFVNLRTKKIEHTVENSSAKTFDVFDAPTLSASEKTFWEDHECIVVSSPERAKHMMAYLIFPKTTNRVDDAEIFKMLASQALLLFCIDRYGAARGETPRINEKR
ncbi:MAG: hypothetical protein A3E38_00060 [Candidatus Moranbacteria bacterium RIFCSPHIGHO2_12_FULL_54_9]|nr:MAG: hypothetical protein A2878_01015 [Candidatus Moranbacteria bacterium RIFCSPHIGHO2_01_FULL_54_31]OGI25687.1 MAG: hypothetical protein A3E38_00060 [Candidatus Moranbacteria bacterium RIFCSPHIGHO2_12_FULL_54_9]